MVKDDDLDAVATALLYNQTPAQEAGDRDLYEAVTRITFRLKRTIDSPPPHSLCKLAS
jgi:hypothetical protein